jgi:TolB-like protein
MLLAQDKAPRIKIAVLRFKSSQETPERRSIVNDLSMDLAAGMREKTRFDMPDDALIKKIMLDNKFNPDGLLDLEKCFAVGKALNVDYVVAGSALLQRRKWHACLRVLSVQNRSLAATAEAEYALDEMNSLYGVLASQISTALDVPPKVDSTMKNFTWQGEYLLSFGKYRIDMDPPILLAANADPPFELSIVAEMAVASGGHAVTNFEVFVDNLGLGSIHGALAPPVPIKVREWVIGSTAFLFSLELKEMRVFTVQADKKDAREFLAPATSDDAKYVTSARFTVKVRPKTKD